MFGSQEEVERLFLQERKLDHCIRYYAIANPSYGVCGFSFFSPLTSKAVKKNVFRETQERLRIASEDESNKQYPFFSSIFCIYNLESFSGCNFPDFFFTYVDGFMLLKKT